MRVSRCLFLGAAVASAGCLLLVSPIAFAEAQASGTPEIKRVPVARPSATKSEQVEVAPRIPATPVLRKPKDRMRRTDEPPVVAPNKALGEKERMAPDAATAPSRILTPNGARNPAAERQLQQSARQFDMQARRIGDEMSSKRKRSAAQQQSELVRENERAMAKIRAHSQSEGRRAKIREQAAELMKNSENATGAQAQAIEEQATKLLEELDAIPGAR